MITNKIIPKLSKAIEKYGVNVEIYRNFVNEFGEKTEDNTLVCKLKGLYFESNHSITKNITDPGTVKKDKISKFIVLINTDSNMVLEGDKIVINNIYFEVINISNANMINAYYEIVLKRC